MLRRILNIAIAVVAIAVVLPIPLAYFVDFTYHWLLLITIPFGGAILTILIVWRVVLGRQPVVKASGPASTS